MAGYQGTPSHPAAPQPAAPDNVAICLHSLSGKMLLTPLRKVFCGRCKYVKTPGDLLNCTGVHLSRTDATILPELCRLHKKTPLIKHISSGFIIQ